MPRRPRGPAGKLAGTRKLAEPVRGNKRGEAGHSGPTMRNWRPSNSSQDHVQLAFAPQIGQITRFAKLRIKHSHSTQLPDWQKGASSTHPLG